MTAPVAAVNSRVPPASATRPALGSQHLQRHKTLPRPDLDIRHTAPEVNNVRDDLVAEYSDTTRTSVSSSSSESHTSSLPTLKHQPRNISKGPDLPPTPPTHSRSSSSSHAPKPSSPKAAEATQTPRVTVSRAPTTPPDQRSPPTPDVTPPQPLNRPKALRPRLGHAGSSRTTPAESRTDSFTTAREEPLSSEDEDERSTIRPSLASNHTSRSTVRPQANHTQTGVLPPRELDLALSRLNAPTDDTYTPRTRQEFGRFDGDWHSTGQQKSTADERSLRDLAVRKTRPNFQTSRSSPRRQPILDDNVVTPTNATKAVQRMSLHEVKTKAHPSGRCTQREVVTAGPSTSATSVHADTRRSSSVSSRSMGSNVVEATVVGQTPSRHRTLRHVRKQHALRDSADSLNRTSLKRPDTSRHVGPSPIILQQTHGRHESVASSKTNQSISSNRARREVWKNGGIPVVVVPDRMSSSRSKSSREPSLRSTSSRRSRRASVGSSAADDTTNRDVPPLSNRNSRRNRAYSESDGSDQRTIDFPPTIPTRSSSLSAPTSRNNSRACSLTAESAVARDTLQQEKSFVAPLANINQAQSDAVKQPVERDTERLPDQRMIWDAWNRDTELRSPETRHYDEPQSPKKFSSRNTPFSAASVTSNGTQPELSEALAVHMYSHQNSSVVVVNHSNKPSDASDMTPRDGESLKDAEYPRITMTAPAKGAPVTPAQTQLALDDIESPLRNPRAPPEPPKYPPAIHFIPATPSGLTPADDKAAHVGNYFDAVAGVSQRRPSFVKRAFSRRRHSVNYPPSSSKPPGILTRTFSLSRNSRRLSGTLGRESSNPDLETRHTYPTAEDIPVEETKLHPFWRPQYADDDSDSCGSDCDHEEHNTSYPPIVKRPHMPRRRLSEKLKRTFAVMPIQDDRHHRAADVTTPERRTIRRTPSGNLRVMRRRNSTDSMGHLQDKNQRPVTAPEVQPRRPFWRGHSAVDEQAPVAAGRRRRSSLGSAVEDIQSLPRRLNEKRREKRTQELRQKISGPQAVRDGVGEVIRSSTRRN